MTIDLPCDVGTEVLLNFETDDGKITTVHGVICSFSYDENKVLWMFCRYENGLTYWHVVHDDLGKCVFLQYKDAQKAIIK